MNNADVEKGLQKNNDANKDDLKKDPDDLKKDAAGDTEEAAGEDSPLKGKEGMDGATDAPTGEKAKEGAKGLGEWLSKSRVKWWIAVLVAVLLVTVILVATLLMTKDDYFDVPDGSVRLVKLWPRPNKPRNIINFVHGSLPVEGRVWPDLTKQLDDLLSRYQPSAYRSPRVVECFGSGPPPEEDKVCKFDIRPLMLECSRSMNYGYDTGKPCVFLEFNNISNWVPEPYSARELEAHVMIADRSANMVYLDCQGDSLVDQENMGRIQYTPDRGFPIKFFPYRGQREYMSPLVAIRFTKPAVGVAISVTCKLWAENLNHSDEAVPSGQISFSLLVD